MGRHFASLLGCKKWEKVYKMLNLNVDRKLATVSCTDKYLKKSLEKRYPGP